MGRIALGATTRIRFPVPCRSSPGGCHVAAAQATEHQQSGCEDPTSAIGRVARRGASAKPTPPEQGSQFREASIGSRDRRAGRGRVVARLGGDRRLSRCRLAGVVVLPPLHLVVVDAPLVGAVVVVGAALEHPVVVGAAVVVVECAAVVVVE